ncbi:MAG: hypothetical protein Q7S89_01620 [bacterium]|nr:hypothetical protein [bacterium]
MQDETPGAPPNLPMEPVDDGGAVPPAQPAALPRDTEDIFADVEAVPHGGSEAAPVAAAHAPTPLAAAPVHGADTHSGIEIEESGGGRKTLLVVIVLVLLVIIGGVVAAWRFGWLTQKSDDIVVPSTDTTVPPDNEQELPVDADFDGLSDAQEQQLGTDAKKPDTDDDGLFDRDEVKVYKTDPLNPDSDGDGFKDGDEVKNGFDPSKGNRARLFDIPSAPPAPTPAPSPAP